MNPQPIETEYDGHRFRSRLEARWAVFFNHLGIQWSYEQEGYELPSGRYLPDFRLYGVVPPGPCDLFVEVKGVLTRHDYSRVLHAAHELPWLGQPAADVPGGTGNPCLQLLLLGDPPPPGAAWTHRAFGRNGDRLYQQAAFFDTLQFGSAAVDVHGGMTPYCHDWLTQMPGFLDNEGLRYELQPMPEQRLTLDPNVDAAYRAARSARFEFGESGGR